MQPYLRFMPSEILFLAAALIVRFARLLGCEATKPFVVLPEPIASLFSFGESQPR